jgi:hypothetical protein
MTTHKIHPKLVEKLKQTRIKYAKVSAIAERIPLFAENIINNEIDGDSYCRLADRFGQLYCAWGINWQTYRPLNYPEARGFPGAYVVVYINAMALFPEDCYHFATTELGKILPLIKVDYYDNLNSTFYFLPEEVDEGLQKLEAWYIQTQSQCAEYRKTQRKAELLRELEDLA